MKRQSRKTWHRLLTAFHQTTLRELSRDFPNVLNALYITVHKKSNCKLSCFCCLFFFRMFPSFPADRILVMSNGSVLCYGSLKFIKMRLNLGYNLNIVKRAYEECTDIEEQMHNFFPDALKTVSKNELFSNIYI